VDILNDVGVIKLSAKNFFLKLTTPLNILLNERIVFSPLGMLLCPSNWTISLYFNEMIVLYFSFMALHYIFAVAIINLLTFRS